MARFPDVRDLAAAPVDEVLHYWSGLGYYARARNLHRAAQPGLRELGGGFPMTWRRMQRCRGSVARPPAAILSLALGQRQVILDGNVKRVLARYFARSGWPGTTAVLESPVGTLAEALTPQTAGGRLQPGHDGSRRDRLHPQQARLRGLPADRDCAAHRAGQAAGPIPGKSRKRLCRSGRCACCWCAIPTGRCAARAPSADGCLGRPVVSARDRDAMPIRSTGARPPAEVGDSWAASDFTPAHLQPFSSGYRTDRDPAESTGLRACWRRRPRLWYNPRTS